MSGHRPGLAVLSTGGGLWRLAVNDASSGTGGAIRFFDATGTEQTNERIDDLVNVAGDGASAVPTWKGRSLTYSFPAGGISPFLLAAADESLPSVPAFYAAWHHSVIVAQRMREECPDKSLISGCFCTASGHGHVTVSVGSSQYCVYSSCTGLATYLVGGYVGWINLAAGHVGEVTVCWSGDHPSVDSFAEPLGPYAPVAITYSMPKNLVVWAAAKGSGSSQASGTLTLFGMAPGGCGTTVELFDVPAIALDTWGDSLAADPSSSWVYLLTKGQLWKISLDDGSYSNFAAGATINPVIRDIDSAYIPDSISLWGLAVLSTADGLWRLAVNDASTGTGGAIRFFNATGTEQTNERIDSVVAGDGAGAVVTDQGPSYTYMSPVSGLTAFLSADGSLPSAPAFYAAWHHSVIVAHR
eukprot:tig00000523_g1873.t1